MTKKLLNAFLLLAFSSAGLGQAAPSSSNPTGVIPNNTYEGDREVVNLGSGNLTVTLPLLNLPGRNGHDFIINATYNSRVWNHYSFTNPISGQATYYWNTENNTQTPIGGLGQGWYLAFAHLEVDNQVEEYGTRCNKNYRLVTADFGKHDFTNAPPLPGGARNQCSRKEGDYWVPHPEDNILEWDSTSGYRLQLDAGGLGQHIVRSNNGTRYYFNSTQLSRIVDSNGNQISFSYSSTETTATDTVGRQVVFRLTHPIRTIEYRDSNGSLQIITLTIATQTGSPSFVAPPQSTTGGSYFRLASIGLPNGRSYSFEYNDYGELTRIAYPTGGYTRYEYTRTSHDWLPGGSDYRQVTAKRVCRNASGTCSQEDVTSYSPSIDSTLNTNESNSVRDPLGNLTVTNFFFVTPTPDPLWPGRGARPLEVKRRIYHGETQLLETVDKTYISPTNSRCSGDAFNIYSTAGWRLSSETTTLNSGLVSKKEYFYDSETVAPSGPACLTEVIETKEYAFGQGTAGPMIRRSVREFLKVNPVNQADYRATGLRITDRIKSEQTYDGNGNLAAQTEFEYDNYTEPISATGAVQREAGFGTSYTTRGNQTAKKRWRNTDGLSLTTRNQFDDAGNIVKTSDPRSHATTFSYVDDWAQSSCGPAGTSRAYVTAITNALMQTTTRRYKSCSGQLASEQDSNGLITTHEYDLMGRRISTSAADASTTTQFDDSALWVRTRTLRESGGARIVNYTYLDGLGRIIQNKLCEDGQDACNSSVKIDRTYDSLGRVLSVSNPYRSTSDSTYGMTTTRYDGLGRVCKLIPPDGQDGTATDPCDNSGTVNIVSTSYGGNSATVTDQAGKQRRTWTDSLGRLSQVDEPSGPIVPATISTGSVTISGSEQSVNNPGQSAAPGSGTVTINGGPQSRTICSPQCFTVWNSGQVTVTVNGLSKSASYGGSTDIRNQIASSIRTAFNNDASSSVTATVSANVITFTAKTSGASTNYSLSSSSTWNTTYFTSAAYTGATSGPTLTGGRDYIPPSTTYDTGTVSITVNGFTKTVNYGQTSTSSSIATALSQAFNADSNSPVNTSANGTLVSLTSKLAGSSANYALSATSSTSQPGTFSQPSFTAARSGPTLTGGTDTSGGLYTPWITTYTYDVLGNLTGVQQKGGAASSEWRIRSFTYNSLSQLITSSNPEAGTVCYGTWAGANCVNGYDDDGNLLKKTDARGITIDYDPTGSPIDALHRVTKKTYSNGDPAVTYSYDQGPIGDNPIGRRTSMTDSSGSTSWKFDPFGRVKSEVRTIGGVQKAIATAYNPDGSIRTLTYPSGRVLTLDYDDAGRVREVRANDGTKYASDPSYFPSGLIDTVKYGAISGGFSGIAIDNHFNKRLQPVFLTATTPSATVMSLAYDFGLGVNNNGNVYSITNNRDSNRSVTYTYDLLNRVGTAYTTTSSLWGNTYTVDPWGNLTKMLPYGGKPEGQHFDQTVDTLNRIVGFCYDASGHLLKSGACGSNYAYDAEGRLVSAAGVTFTYDGDGRRVRKSSGTIYWGASSSAGPLAESDLSGNIRREYIYVGDRRIARHDSPSGAVHYFFSDHLGSAVVVTDSVGTMAPCPSNPSVITGEEESDFYPYGGELVICDRLADQNFKFTGKERDTETGFDYFGARYYAASHGRFLTPDSTSYAGLSNPQSWNLYAYTLNNPLRYSDPVGRAVQCKTSSTDCLKAAQASVANQEAASRLYINTVTETKQRSFLGIKWGSTTTTRHFVGIKGDVGSFAKLGENAAKMADLVSSTRVFGLSLSSSATPTYTRLDDKAIAGGAQKPLHGGAQAYTTSMNTEPEVFVDPAPSDAIDTDAKRDRIPGANFGEKTAHELLGHLWSEEIAGNKVGTAQNKKDSIKSENVVRATDPARGQKKTHHD